MGRKTPFVTASQLEDIASRFPTPFYLYDEKGIRKTAQSVLDAFSWNPGFREYFAVKACPNPAIIQILLDMGFGLDVSSECELIMAERMGVSGERIMFSSNDTPLEEFVHAARLGATVNLDDITHIDSYQEAVGSFPEVMSMRLNPGEFPFANGIFGKPAEAKFGMTMDQMLEATRRLMSLGVKRFGIHALLASNTVTDDYYPTLARTLFAAARRLNDELGAKVAFVNLSGGVGIDYRPEERPNDIFKIAEGVRRAYEEELVPAGMGDVAIFTEMGRFITGPYGALVTRVIHEKHIYHDYLGVDACAADLMRPMLYGAYHHITVMGREDEPCDHTYDVTGALCENSDRLANDRALPECHPGDLLYIHDVGAHGHCMGYNYNGRLRHAELLLEPDGDVRLIRRAETPSDYFATLDVLEGWDAPVDAGASKPKTGRP
jgi:diaminopimelate decarboxylase